MMMDGESERPTSSPAWYWMFQIPLFYGCLLVLGLTLLGGSLLCVVLIGLLSRDAGRRVGRSLIGLSFRAFLRLTEVLGLMRLDLTALDRLNQSQGVIIAPNHPSMLDVLLIVSRMPQACCIMKSNLWGNVFLGSGARLAGYIRNDSLQGMVKQACAELQRGGQLLMFPEGTRTVRQPINRLKGGIALIARASQAPIQTVILQTNSPYLAKGWPLFKPPVFPLIYQARIGQCFDAQRHIQQTLEHMQHYYEDELGHASESPRHGTN